MDIGDYQTIKALLFSYAEFVDRADFEAVAELLGGAELGSDGQVVNASADFIKTLYSTSNRIHADGTLKTKHVCSNVIITPRSNPQQAAARSYYVVLQATDKLALQPIVAGRYEDEFEKNNGNWRFSRRVVHVDLIGDVSDHLLGGSLKTTSK